MNALAVIRIDCNTIGLYVHENQKNGRCDERKKVDLGIVLTTFGMGSEGIDIPQLNSIVLAMPKKDVDQLTGRVIRSVGASIDASIFDVVDESVDFLKGQTRCRNRFYKRAGYHILPTKSIARFETTALFLRYLFALKQAAAFIYANKGLRIRLVRLWTALL